MAEYYSSPSVPLLSHQQQGRQLYIKTTQHEVPCPEALGYTQGKTLGSGTYAAWSPFERKMASTVSSRNGMAGYCGSPSIPLLSHQKQGRQLYIKTTHHEVPCPEALGYTQGKTLGSGTYAKVKAAWSPFERKMVSTVDLYTNRVDLWISLVQLAR